MPKLTLEHSSNIMDTLEPTALFAELHQLLADQAEARLADCKSSITSLDQCYIGDGNSDNAYAFLKIELIRGRSPEVRQTIGETSLGLLKQQFSKSCANLNMQISVHIVEMERENYFKYISE